MVIDADAAVRDYGIKAGRTLIGPNGHPGKIIAVDLQAQTITLAIDGKTYPPASLGRVIAAIQDGKAKIKQ